MIFTVKKIYSILIGLIIVSNFNACLAVYDSIDSINNSSLPDNTPLIMSFLNYSPQGYVFHHEQVWVGYVNYQKPNHYVGSVSIPPDLIPGVWWPHLSGNISNFLYFLSRLYYSYDDGAVVQIVENIYSNDPQITVTLTYEGNGVYGDVNNELTIEKGKNYGLKVQLSDGRRYIALTKMPEFEWTPPDTFYVQPYLEENSDGEYVESSAPINSDYTPSLIPNGNEIPVLTGFPSGVEVMEGKSILASEIELGETYTFGNNSYGPRGIEWGPWGLSEIQTYNYSANTPTSNHFQSYWFRRKPSDAYRLPAKYYYCDSVVVRLSAYSNKITAHGDGRGWWLHSPYFVSLNGHNEKEDRDYFDQINRFIREGDNANFFIGSSNLNRDDLPSKKYPYIVGNNDALGVFAGVTTYYGKIPVVVVRDGYDPVSIGWLTEAEAKPYRDGNPCHETNSSQ